MFKCFYNLSIGKQLGSVIVWPRGVQTNLPTDPPGRSDLRTGWPNVGDGLSPPEPVIDGFDHEKPKKSTRPYYHQKKSLFSVDGSVSPVVLVWSVEKWLDICEIRRDLIESGLILAYAARFGTDSMGFSKIRWISAEFGVVLQISTLTENRPISDEVQLSEPTPFTGRQRVQKW